MSFWTSWLSVSQAEKQACQPIHFDCLNCCMVLCMPTCVFEFVYAYPQKKYAWGFVHAYTTFIVYLKIKTCVGIHKTIQQLRQPKWIGWQACFSAWLTDSHESLDVQKDIRKYTDIDMYS